MLPYQAFYSDLVAEFILNLPKRRQRKVVDICNQLAEQPFITSDYRLIDRDGREIEHILVGGFVISYWVDMRSRK